MCTNHRVVSTETTPSGWWAVYVADQGDRYQAIQIPIVLWVVTHCDEHGFSMHNLIMTTLGAAVEAEKFAGSSGQPVTYLAVIGPDQDGQAIIEAAVQHYHATKRAESRASDN